MDLARRSLEGPPLEAEELLALLGPEVSLLPLLNEAYIVRRRFFEKRVQVHILNNARNARCPEDCGYCSQSAVTRAPGLYGTRRARSPRLHHLSSAERPAERRQQARHRGSDKRP